MIDNDNEFGAEIKCRFDHQAIFKYTLVPEVFKWLCSVPNVVMIRDWDILNDIEDAKGNFLFYFKEESLCAECILRFG